MIGILCFFFFVGLAFSETIPVVLNFSARVGKSPFACGQTYEGIGLTSSTIKPRDFRLYLHNIRLINESGKEVALELEQDGKWQLDNLVLLDFEDGTGPCSNGTPDTNMVIRGSAPRASYKGVRFTVGVPASRNHSDIAGQPSPLNLTAMFWAWNAGHKFIRIEFASTGQPRGYVIHIGSTRCVAGNCRDGNRTEVELLGFDPTREPIIADLAELLKTTNVDQNQKGTGEGCMSAPDDSDCAGIFRKLGLAFGKTRSGPQTFFHKQEMRN